ncbi:MAG: hypothetical protein P0S95_00415 [Rhabdochlamydiaceae bacterium]|nr:hypothetical protein [Candidatus Amphrikana amoebophyrae]
MTGDYLKKMNKPFIQSNIYSNKSAVVLEWLLCHGVTKATFSIREVEAVIDVSIGLIQKVFANLVYIGVLQVVGVRTAKKFMLYDSSMLIEYWLMHYSIVKKCKLWTYSCGIARREDRIKALQKSPLGSKVALALHSAAEGLGVKNTNLQTLELYMLDNKIKGDIEALLQLEPQERGYGVLLIEPYYEHILNQSSQKEGGVTISSPLLTFLDLYHFPLRGLEQSEYMATKFSELKSYQKQV